MDSVTSILLVYAHSPVFLPFRSLAECLLSASGIQVRTVVGPTLSAPQLPPSRFTPPGVTLRLPSRVFAISPSYGPDPGIFIDPGEQKILYPPTGVGIWLRAELSFFYFPLPFFVRAHLFVPFDLLSGSSFYLELRFSIVLGTCQYRHLFYPVLVGAV